MADLLLLVGICLVFWSLWQYRRQKQADIDEVVRLQHELIAAREDVSILMKELTNVSGQVVDTISERIKAARETISQLENTTLEKALSDGKEVKQENSIFMENKVINLMENRQKEKELRREPRKERAGQEIKQKAPADNTKPAAENYANKGATAKHQAVYSLAELGYPAEEIARKLSIGKGEVALILQLKYKGEEVHGL